MGGGAECFVWDIILCPSSQPSKLFNEVVWARALPITSSAPSVRCERSPRVELWPARMFILDCINWCGQPRCGRSQQPLLEMLSLGSGPGSVLSSPGSPGSYRSRSLRGQRNIGWPELRGLTSSGDREGAQPCPARRRCGALARAVVACCWLLLLSFESSQSPD